MNATLKLLSIFTILSLLISCSQKKEETDETNETAREEWPAMDEFHVIMAEAFHPFMDSANLEPAIKMAAQIASGAEKWLNEPLPEKINNDEVKTMLQQLKENAASFAQLIKTGDSTQIGESLTKLHDQFHELQETFYSNGKHEHGEHKH